MTTNNDGRKLFFEWMDVNIHSFRALDSLSSILLKEGNWALGTNHFCVVCHAALLGK